MPATTNNIMIPTVDGRKKNGGFRFSAGRKRVDPEEKKLTVSFQIKRKHVKDAKAKIQVLVDRINSK